MCARSLSNVSFRSPREQDGEALSIRAGADMLSTSNPDVVEDEETETPIYEKYNALLHGSLRSKRYVCRQRRTSCVLFRCRIKLVKNVFWID